MRRIRLLYDHPFAPPLPVQLSPYPILGFRERWHPEREVDNAVHSALVERFGPTAVVRQYRGWKRADSSRAASIPDFLVVHGEWSRLVVVEVKAFPAGAAEVRQLERYVRLALDMPSRPDVFGVLAAPGFGTSLPEWVSPWRLEIEMAGL